MPVALEAVKQTKKNAIEEFQISDTLRFLKIKLTQVRHVEKFEFRLAEIATDVIL